jgi:hypothetical protein
MMAHVVCNKRKTLVIRAPQGAVEYRRGLSEAAACHAVARSAKAERRAQPTDRQHLSVFSRQAAKRMLSGMTHIITAWKHLSVPTVQSVPVVPFHDTKKAGQHKCRPAVTGISARYNPLYPFYPLRRKENNGSLEIMNHGCRQ